MTKADPLMAAFRQLAAGKAASRLGRSECDDREGQASDKAEHFREQLRSIAQGQAEAEPRFEARHQGVRDRQLTQDPEVSGSRCGSRGRGGDAGRKAALPPDDDIRQQQAAARSDAVAAGMAWSGSRSQRGDIQARSGQTPSARDDAATPRVALPQSQCRTPRDDAVEPRTSRPIEIPKADELPEQRFALSVDAAETRTRRPVKVAVREQETHFEPVPQLTLLQKIVDRIGADIPAASRRPLPEPPTPLCRISIEGRQAGPNADASTGSAEHRRRHREDAAGRRCRRGPPFGGPAGNHANAPAGAGALTDVMQSAGYTFDIASIDHTPRSDANPGAGQSAGAVGPAAIAAVAAADRRSATEPRNGSPAMRRLGRATTGRGMTNSRKPAERHRDQESCARSEWRRCLFVAWRPARARTGLASMRWRVRPARTAFRSACCMR